MSSPPQHEKGWEPKDVDVPAIFIIALVVVLGTILCGLVSGALFRLYGIRANETDTPPPAIAHVISEQPAEPRLQTAPRLDYAIYRAEQEKRLQGYAWIDQKAGIIRLPINRAMDLLVQRGLPATSPAGSDLQFRQTQGGGKSP